jgi:hypothetical protein
VVWQGSAGDRRPYADLTRGIPHIFFVPPGNHITYVLLKFPAKGQ